MFMLLTRATARRTLRAWLDSPLHVVRQGECSIWLRATDRDGYPQAQLSQPRRCIRVHRLACYVNHGPPPFSGAHACHSCDTPRCVEPAHLRWSTPAGNAADMVARGRCSLAGRRPVMRLTLGQIADIKADTRPLAQIAADLGCSYKTVAKIRGGRRGVGQLGRRPKL